MSTCGVLDVICLGVCCFFCCGGARTLKCDSRANVCSVCGLEKYNDDFTSCTCNNSSRNYNYRYR